MTPPPPLCSKSILITLVISDVYRNCLNVMSNGSAFSVLFLEYSKIVSTKSRALKLFCIEQLRYDAKNSILASVSFCWGDGIRK